MTEFNLSELTSVLDTQSGVSYKGKTKTWDTSEDVQDLVRDIDDCKQLHYLNLEGNTLGVPAAESIGEALKKHPEFKEALWKDLFTRRLKEEIPVALQFMGKGIITAGASLTVLDLSDNALGPNGMTGLVELLASPACYSLQELYLNNCGLGIDGSKMLCKALLECHKKGSAEGKPLRLKVLVAGRNRLENPGAKALAGVFSELETLEHVAIPQNGIYFDGIAALSQAFMLNPNMRILNLNDNTIRSKGAVSLAEALYSMQKLEDINFGDCLLKTNGAIYITEAIRDGHTDLKILNLSYNEIGAEGGLKIASALENKRLDTLMVDGNQFGSECRDKIKQILQEQSNDNALGSLEEDESQGEEEEEVTDENQSECDEDGEEYNGEDDENYTDEDAHYADETDEEAADDVNYVTALTDKALNDTGNTTLHENVTIESFCTAKRPTLDMFNKLEETNKTDGFREFLQSYKDEDYIICLIFLILKCSSLGDESPEASRVAADLYKDAFDYAVKNNELTRVKNFFLIQLGLLKCEEKLNPQHNIKACRNVLKASLEKNVFPDDVKMTFKLFLDRFA